MDPNGPQSARALADITEALVRFHRQYYGKGPTQAKSYSINDTVVCMLWGGFTTVEKTLIDSGNEEAVQSIRTTFQRAMENEFVGTVQEVTNRHVLAYMSQVHTNPDISVEIFVLEPGKPLEPAEYEQELAGEGSED
jgi:uncharacterized protein YbcI